jgi:hypothetical protein
MRQFANDAVGTLLYGAHAGSAVILPRITCIITSAQSHLPFAVLRRQYPLIPGYAFTVHRSQGTTLDLLGLYFNGVPFCHGLLFTALSRVKGDWSKIAVCSSVPHALQNCVVLHVLQLLMH